MRDDSVERVVAVDGFTVTTERGRARIRYLGVVESLHVGDRLERPPTHRARQTYWQWSPFDEPGDVDTIDDDASEKRTF